MLNKRIFIFVLFFLIISSVYAIGSEETQPQKSDSVQKDVVDILNSTENLSNSERGELLKQYFINNFGDELVHKETDPLTGELTSYDALGTPDFPGREEATMESALGLAEAFVRTNSRFPDRNAALGPVTSLNGMWMVHWDHVIRGVTAEGDFINVLVRRDGSVVAFTKIWNVPDDVNTEPKLSKIKAFKLAGVFLKKKGAIYDLDSKRFNLTDEWIENEKNAVLVSPDSLLLLDNYTQLMVSNKTLYWFVAVRKIPSDYAGFFYSRTHYVSVNAFTGEFIGWSQVMGDTSENDLWPVFYYARKYALFTSNMVSPIHVLMAMIVYSYLTNTPYLT